MLQQTSDQRAAQALLQVDDTDALVPYAGLLLDLCKHRDAFFRQAAVTLVGRLPVASREAHTHVATMIRMLGDAEELVRLAASAALDGCSSYALAPHVDALGDLLLARRAYVRRTAIHTMRRLDAAVYSDASIRQLGRMCSDVREAADLRSAARTMLGRTQLERGASSGPLARTEWCGVEERDRPGSRDFGPGYTPGSREWETRPWDRWHEPDVEEFPVRVMRRR